MLSKIKKKKKKKIQIMGSVPRKHSYTRRKLKSKKLPFEQNIKMTIGLFVQYLIKDPINHWY